MVGGMHGWIAFVAGVRHGGACKAGACMAGGHVWQGCVWQVGCLSQDMQCGEGHAWWVHGVYDGVVCMVFRKNCH